MMVLSEKDLCGLQSPVGGGLVKNVRVKCESGNHPNHSSLTRSRVFRGFGVGVEIGRLPTTKIL